MQEALEFLTREELLEEIRRQHAYKQTVESAGSVGVWEANLKTGVGLWSTEKRRLHGWERHDETPTTMNSILRHVHPDDRAYLQDVFTTKYKQGDSITYTYRIELPNGEIRWLSSRGKVLAAEDGIATKILGVTLDVTENKRVEQQLQELNQALVQRTQEANHRAAQLQLLATQITQIENRERRRLALLLHDHLQQILIGCRMKMGQLKLLCQSAGLSPNASYAELLTQTTELVNEAIRASRSLSVELSPPMLYEAGLPASLEWLAEQMETKHGLHVDVQTTDEPEDEDVRIFLYQCIRELLFNVVKHAQTSTARVVMQRKNAEVIEITVCDSGAGFDAAKISRMNGESFGLRSIRERLNLLGGGLEVISSPGQGTQVILLAPMRKTRGSIDEIETLEPSLTFPSTSLPKRLTSEKSASSAAMLLSGFVSPMPFPTPLPMQHPAPLPTQLPIRILLANHHPVVCQGLCSLLETEPGFKIARVATDSDAAVQAAVTSAVDVAVIDYHLPPANGVQIIRRIRAIKPGLPIIAMAISQEGNIADAMRQAGACSFFRKDDSTETLITAIRSCATR